MELSQDEANNLIKIEKKRNGNQSYMFPSPGTHTVVPLLSMDGTIEFTLNFYHAIIKRNKVQAAELYEKGVLLLRMCIGGKHHTNPQGSAPLAMFSGLEGQDTGEHHLHYYAEGWGTSWSVPLDIDPSLFYPLTRLSYHFMDLCHVVDKPVMTGGL
jgi:hypothetical protein